MTKHITGVFRGTHGRRNWLKACIEIQIFLTMLVSLVVRFAEKLEADALDKKHYEMLVVISTSC